MDSDWKKEAENRPTKLLILMMKMAHMVLVITVH